MSKATDDTDRVAKAILVLITLTCVTAGAWIALGAGAGVFAFGAALWYAQVSS